MSEWDRPPAEFVPRLASQVQRLARDGAAGAVKPRRRVGWAIPPQCNADFRLAGGRSPNPEPGSKIAATLTDQDGSKEKGKKRKWQLSDDAGSSWADIAGATSRRYTPVASDQGKTLRAVFTYEDGHGVRACRRGRRAPSHRRTHRNRNGPADRVRPALQLVGQRLRPGVPGQPRERDVRRRHAGAVPGRGGPSATARTRNWRFEAETGYGFEAVGEGALDTYNRLSADESGQTWTVGAGYTAAGSLRLGVEVVRSGGKGGLRRQGGKIGLGISF